MIVLLLVHASAESNRDWVVCVHFTFIAEINFNGRSLSQRTKHVECVSTAFTFVDRQLQVQRLRRGNVLTFIVAMTVTQILLSGVLVSHLRKTTKEG